MSTDVAYYICLLCGSRGDTEAVIESHVESAHAQPEPTHTAAYAAYRAGRITRAQWSEMMLASACQESPDNEIANAGRSV